MTHSGWEGGDIFKAGISDLLEGDEMKLVLFLVAWMTVPRSHTKELGREGGGRGWW